MIFFLFLAHNIDYGYTLEPPHDAVQTSTHNLCFRAKIRRKNEYPVNPSLLYKSKTLLLYRNYKSVRGCKLCGRVILMHCIFSSPEPKAHR